MTSAMTAEHASPLGTLARVIALLLLGLGAALALVFAAAAAVVIGAVVLGAALALSLMPHPEPRKVEVLDARRTPSGWVVEGGARRRS